MSSGPVPALERCVGDVRAFLDGAWAREPLYRPAADSDGFADLLTLRDVDRLIASGGLRLPTFRMVKAGETIPSSSYTTSGRTGSVTYAGIADPPRVFEAFREGATLVLQGMHRYWEPLARFCRDLELTLGHPTQVNAYITPAGSQGLAVHEDAHDVFVLQLHGRKGWEVYPPGDHERPDRTLEMAPGDALYLPLGTPHSARTEETASAHLTVGILTTTWGEVLRDVVKRAEDEPVLSDRLPAGWHRDLDRFAAEARSRLDELAAWLGKADPHELAARRVRRFLTTRRPLVPGGLEAIVALESIGDETELRRRPGSVCEVRVDDDRLSVLLGDRELRMPLWLEAVMRAIADRPAFRPADLEPWLDEASRLVLARRLVREGLLLLGPAADGG